MNITQPRGKTNNGPSWGSPLPRNR
ncbi:hypothetical protein YPPY64_1485, partial [Yersinia pestis PY-64]